MNGDPSQLSWIGRSRISSKLVAIVAAFILVQAAVIVLFVLGYSVNTGVRAYIAGEGLWSKGQKDAVYALTRYLETRQERDYRDYLSAIDMPLGDRAARLEMEKPEYDTQVVIDGFGRGGIAAEDVPYMIFLFRHFDTLPFFSQAVAIWRRADAELLHLPRVAEEVRASIRAGRYNRAEQQRQLAKIHQINNRVTPLENEFSQVLSAGAREVQALLLRITLAISAALTALGVLFAFSISRDLRKSIAGLSDGATRVAMGDLSQPVAVRSDDELGELVRVFNEMMAARQETETALRAATDFREKVMDSATNAIYTMDLEGRFTTANRRTCEITGYSLDELIGKSWTSMVREQDLPELKAVYASVIESCEPVSNREMLLRRQDGSWRLVMFSSAPLRRDGRVFAVVGTAEDITERKHAEDELNARAEELVRSNRELEQFAYVASHDLQEPLRTVTGFAQLLARRYKGKVDAEADEFVGFITDGVTRMKSLIEDLLAFSRVQREPRAVAMVDLNSLLANAEANLGAAIASAGAAVTHAPLPTLPVDAGQITQLFQNLVGNALKFRREEAPTVHVEAEQRERDWLFSVTDNGIGIDAEASERVFALFQRLHTRDHYEGNGIGLTICKKIVELHRGRIWIEPAPGGQSGTTFHFTLPAR